MSDDLYVFTDAKNSSGALTAIVTGIASAVAAVAITTAVAAPSQTPPSVAQASQDQAAPVAAGESQDGGQPAQDPNSQVSTAQSSAGKRSNVGTEVLYYNKSGVAQPKSKAKSKTTAKPKATTGAVIAPVGNVTSPTTTGGQSYGNSSGPTAAGSGNSSSPTGASGSKKGREGRDGD